MIPEDPDAIYDAIDNDDPHDGPDDESSDSEEDD